MPQETTKLEGTPYFDGFGWYIMTPAQLKKARDPGYPPADSRLVAEGIHVERSGGGWSVIEPTRKMAEIAGKVVARTAARTAAAARTEARTQKAPKAKSRSQSPARSVTRRNPRLPAYEGYSKAAENAAFKEFRALGVGRRKPGQTAQVSPASRSRSRSPKAKAKTARTKTAKKSRSRSRSPGYVYIGDKRRKGMGEGTEGPVLPYNYRTNSLFSRRRPRGSVTRVGSANLEAALARLRSTRRQRAPQEFARRFTGRSASPLRGARTTYGAVGTVENPIRSEAATRIARFYRTQKGNRPAAAVVMGAPVMGAPQSVPRNSRNSESEEFFE